MKNIEVELRSFITEDKYKELLNFFDLNGEFKSKNNQETFYFDCKEDLRIQKNDDYAKVWMKKGNMHDEAREEIEIRFEKEDFNKMEKLFLSLGYDVDIKWFRTRYSYSWQGIDVSVDDTRGYGYIIELEILSDEKDKDKNLDYLKSKMSELGVISSSKDEFVSKFDIYKNFWKDLIK
ncbi:MAG: CYTH domain-containing protein [Candidatus Gracilibacteria bacterium]|nr:CYTH domain-containing protein [Candidatus Gracilibacteria bacterium]